MNMRSEQAQLEEILSSLPQADAKYIRELFQERYVSDEVMVEVDKIDARVRKQAKKELRSLLWQQWWMELTFKIGDLWFFAEEQLYENISNGGKVIGSWLDRSYKPLQEAKKFSIHEFNELFVLGSAVVFLLLGAVELLSLLWPLLGIILYGTTLIFFIAIVIVGYLGISKASEANNEETNIAASLAASIGMILAFSQLCRYSFLIWGGFDATSSNYWYWLRFGVANFLEASLFDIPNIYKWNITNIQASTSWSRSYLFVFRTVLEFIVVASILTYTKEMRNRWETSTSVEPISYSGFILINIKRFAFASIWLMLLSYLVSIWDGAQVEHINIWANITPFLLPIVGFWFIWINVKALWLQGRLNKLFALLGVTIGSWVMYDYLFL